MIDGILLVDKPAGPTSHDVVGMIRRISGQRRVGHAGTLDPPATGLLVVLLGRTTRLADAFSGADKSYEAEIALGSATDTGDGAGTVTRSATVPPLAEAQVVAALGRMSGERRHVPHAFSAVKSGGRPLYELARAGQEVPAVEPRTVTVWRAELLELSPDVLRVRFDVSKGTYIRVLAEELGDELGVPAHLGALRRLRSGTFVVSDAHALADLERGGARAVEEALVDPVLTPLGLPRASLNDPWLEDLLTGRPLPAEALSWIDEEGPEVLVIDAGDGPESREGDPPGRKGHHRDDKGPAHRVLAWYRSAGDGTYRPQAVFATRSVA